MSEKVTLPELRERLPELLKRAVATGEECVIEQNGKDYAVIVSAREWKRRTLGKRLDALGPAFRLAPGKQSRIEVLLSEKQRRRLTPAERQELKMLLRESDAVMHRRAEAMSRLP